MIDAWLDSEQAYRQLPSVAVSLVHGDRTLLAKGYGSVSGQSGGAPVTQDTVYSICSVSKLFTSIALMQLVEQGKLQLEDPLAKHLPEFQMASADPSAGPVTLRGVLMHAAGLPRETVNDIWTGPDYPFPTREEMLAGLARQSLFMPPLQRNQYSNLGIALLGEVVARVSGQPYERYVMERVVRPMGLAHTSLGLPFAEQGSRMAVGHSTTRRDGTRTRMKPFDTRGVAAAAGFASTAGDLAKLASWQLRTASGDDNPVLKPASLREMTRIQWTDPDGRATWGLGFAVSRVGNEQFVSHAGQCPGYRTSYLTQPAKNLGAVVLLGSLDDPGPMARQLMALVQKQPGNGKLEAQPYVGRYLRSEGEGELIVRAWGGDLVVLSVPTATPAETMSVYRADGPDRFRLVREDRSLGEVMTFIRDAGGQVTSMRIWGVMRRKQP